jgi:hypothetical protein
VGKVLSGKTEKQGRLISIHAGLWYIKGIHYQSCMKSRQISFISILLSYGPAMGGEFI